MARIAWLGVLVLAGGLGAVAAATEVDEGPVNVEHDCSGDISVHHEEDDGGVVLRIVGLYQSDAPHEVMGDVDVRLELDEPTVLVLAGYEPIHWHVEEAVPGALIGVLARGSTLPQVTAPQGVAVQTFEVSPNAHDWFDPDARDLVDWAEALSGAGLRSFHGCYEATGFSIVEGTGSLDPDAELDCDAVAEPLQDAPDTSVLDGLCSDVIDESYVCLAHSPGGILAVGLDTGTICDALPASPDDRAPRPTSMAWLGSDVYTCSGEHGVLTRTSLLDGTVQRSFANCKAVTSHDGGLLLQPPLENPATMHQLWKAGSFLDAHCGHYQVIPVDLHASRITAHDDVVYTAWHSTSEIDRFHLPGGDPAGTVQLQGFDTWIDGMSVLDGEQLVVNAAGTQGRLAVFDIDGGQLSWAVDVPPDLGGLVCVSGGWDPEHGDDDDDDGDDDDGDDDDGSLDDELGDGGLTPGGTDCACSSGADRAGRGWLAATWLGVLALTAGRLTSGRRRGR